MNDHQRDALQRIKDLCLELRLALDELDEPPKLSVVDPEVIELEGMIGRPAIREVKGKTLFTAGLKVSGEDRWLNLVAWNALAASASTIQRGMMVRVVGKIRDVQYVNDQGILTSKQELTASGIYPLIAVSSGSTPSRVGQNGTT